MRAQNMRITFYLDNEDAKKIEEYRWTHRIKSLSEAVAIFVRAGIEKLEVEDAEDSRRGAEGQ